MRKLQLEYHIKNISSLYEEGSVAWHNAEFIFNKDFTAHLKLYENYIEPEQISQTWKTLEERGENFQVAMKYLGNRSVAFSKNKYITYFFDEREFTLRTAEEITYLTKYLRGEIENYCVGFATLPMPTCSGTITIHPAPLPRIMPLIPRDLHAKAATLIVAEEVANYPDLQLKLAYLLLEDLVGKDTLKKDKIKFVRDFVSHPVCDNTDVVSFINSELTSAQINDATSIKPKVCFNRDKSDHIAFVYKYASITLQKARELFNAEVEKLGGCIRS